MNIKTNNMNKEIEYNKDGHAIDPRQYNYWSKLAQCEKNNLYARYVFLCEMER